MGLMTNVTTYEALANKYKHFTTPTIVIKVNEKLLPTQILNYLEHATIALTCKLDEMNVAELRFTDLYDYAKSSFSKECMNQYFKLGTPIEIALGYTETEKVFKGYIYESEFGVSTEGMSITVICKDLMGLLANKQDDSYKNSGNQVEEIKKILTDGHYSSYAKLSNMSYINQLSAAYKKLDAKSLMEQSYTAMTLLDKVRWVAHKHHYECFIVYDEVIFRPEKQDYSKAIMTLSLQKGLLSMHMKQCLGKAIAEAEIRGQDSETYTPLSAKQKKNLSSNLVKNKDGTAKVIIYDEEARKQEDANTSLKGLMQRNKWDVISVQAETVGIPEIVPGRRIKMEGISENMNRYVYIKSVTHEVDKTLGFHTQFEGGMDIDE